MIRRGGVLHPRIEDNPFQTMADHPGREGLNRYFIQRAPRRRPSHLCQALAGWYSYPHNSLNNCHCDDPIPDMGGRLRSKLIYPGEIRGNILGILSVDQDAAIYVATLLPERPCSARVMGSQAVSCRLRSRADPERVAAPGGDRARNSDEPELTIRAPEGAELIPLNLS